MKALLITAVLLVGFSASAQVQPIFGGQPVASPFMPPARPVTCTTVKNFNGQWVTVCR